MFLNVIFHHGDTEKQPGETTKDTKVHEGHKPPKNLNTVILKPLSWAKDSPGCVGLECYIRALRPRILVKEPGSGIEA
jgi:hypothetical protein